MSETVEIIAIGDEVLRGEVTEHNTVYLAALLTSPVTALAEHGDQTLRYYMSNSTVVVSATIVSQPKGITDEAGVVRRSFSIQVVEVLYSRGGRWMKKKDRIRVGMTRYEMTETDALPFLSGRARRSFR